MDVESSVIVETDASEWPNKFVIKLDGTSENAFGDCWWIFGDGSRFDESDCIERVSPGLYTNYSGEKGIQVLFFI